MAKISIIGRLSYYYLPLHNCISLLQNLSGAVDLNLMTCYMTY